MKKTQERHKCEIKTELQGVVKHTLDMKLFHIFIWFPAQLRIEKKVDLNKLRISILFCLKSPEQLAQGKTTHKKISIVKTKFFYFSFFNIKLIFFLLNIHFSMRVFNAENIWDCWLVWKRKTEIFSSIFFI